MSTKVHDELVLVCASFMQNEAGRKFVEAFKPYVEDARNACIEAPPEWLHQAQGTARGLSILLQLIEKAPDEARDIVKKRETILARGKP